MKRVRLDAGIVARERCPLLRFFAVPVGWLEGLEIGQLRTLLTSQRIPEGTVEDFVVEEGCRFCERARWSLESLNLPHLSMLIIRPIRALYR